MIGYYVHHHGMGHLTRARAIAEQMAEPITVLSSRPPPPPGKFESWIELDHDVGDAAVTTTGLRPARSDPTAHGTLHWAPQGVDGFTARMATVAAWVAETRPRLVVVDVSVEVATLVRLLGVPVVVMAMPGERVDDAHTLAYRMADHVIAPWSVDVYDPPWLRPFATKTSYVGSISRFAGIEVSAPAEPGTVLVLGGAGGSNLDVGVVNEAAAATPEFRWSTAGVAGGPWIDDVWASLISSTVVVTHAGQNAIADVAAARASAVVIAQDRPFGEQRATARALADAEIAVSVDHWPDAAEWPDLLARATQLDAAKWVLLRIDGAARRAAAVLNSL